MSSLHPRMLCAEFDWNWPSGSGEDFWTSYFRDFVIISTGTLKRVWPFIWKFKSSSSKDALWQVWLKLARDSEEDFLILSMHFPYFILALLENGHGPWFEQLESPLPKDNLCLIWFNCPSCSRECDKLTDRGTDHRWSEKFSSFQAFSSGELKKKEDLLLFNLPELKA